MKRLTVYLAGPMTGLPGFNFNAFFKAEKDLMDAGYDVINPAAHDLHETGFNPQYLSGKETAEETGFCVEEALAWDLEQILNFANAIVILPGWEKSTGTLLELALARGYNIPAYTVESALKTKPQELLLTVPLKVKLNIDQQLRADNWARAYRVDGYDAGVQSLKGTYSANMQTYPGLPLVPKGFEMNPYPFEGVMSDGGKLADKVVGFPETGEVRTTSSTGGEKGMKPQDYSLLPWEALAEVAEHYHKGASKYSAHNWRKGYEWSKSFSALMRHATLFWGGEDIDEETSSNHMAAVVFHALTLLTFYKDNPEFDDRYKAGK